MQWLIAHMWTALAATGVLGLLLGWAVRGLRLRGKLRKAEGERNIAQGALVEKEVELDAMYAAGRAPSAQTEERAPADEHEHEVSNALADSQEKLRSLADELARSKAEVNDLRNQIANTDQRDISAEAVGSAVAGIATGAALAGDARLDSDIDPEEASLEWRNRYLESRVRSLEAQVKKQSADPITGDAGTAAAVPATVVDAKEESASEASDAELAKLRWKTDYLRQRLSYFEKYGTPTAGSVPSVVERASAETGIPENESDAAGGTSDEEIASLRWRNRYLEGRLAYYEGDKAIADEGDSGIAELAETTAFVSDPMDLSENVEDVAAREPVEEVDADIEPVEIEVLEVEPEIDSVEAELEPEEDNVTSEDGDTEIVAQELVPIERGTKPLALEGPVDGEGDDLTAIGGIGPKIQEVLNGFGVFHYDQIAAWTPENVEWVDDHLAFEGRIEREQWVQQAEALSNVG